MVFYPVSLPEQASDLEDIEILILPLVSVHLLELINLLCLSSGKKQQLKLENGKGESCFAPVVIKDRFLVIVKAESGDSKPPELKHSTSVLVLSSGHFHEVAEWLLTLHSQV